MLKSKKRSFSPNVPIMVWDGECSFCKKFAERFEARSKNLVEFIPYQLLSGKYPDAPKYDYQNSVYFLENSVACKIKV